MVIPTSDRCTSGWRLETTMPSGWAEAVQRLDGSFFHAPLGLHAGAPHGSPIYAMYVRAEEVRGIALGVSTTCRLAGSACHAYFPTWPAFQSPGDQLSGLPRLSAALRDAGIVEVRWDSFDAADRAPPPARPTRSEYILDLTAIDEPLVWPPAHQHRRAIRRGDREGWTLRQLTGAEATFALTAAVDGMVERRAHHGREIHAMIPPMAADLADETPAGRAMIWGAFDDTILLGAMLLGIGPTRAFYVMGGATPAGYECGVAAWLHARLAGRLAAGGLGEYNLGGVPVAAVEPTDPSHGLHRFKSGFATRIVPCAGDRWILRAGHERGHRFLGWVTGRQA